MLLDLAVKVQEEGRVTLTAPVVDKLFNWRGMFEQDLQAWCDNFGIEAHLDYIPGCAMYDTVTFIAPVTPPDSPAPSPR